jgi:hypothetical protein
MEFRGTCVGKLQVGPKDHYSLFDSRMDTAMAHSLCWQCCHIKFLKVFNKQTLQLVNWLVVSNKLPQPVKTQTGNQKAEDVLEERICYFKVK